MRRFARAQRSSVPARRRARCSTRRSPSPSRSPFSTRRSSSVTSTSHCAVRLLPRSCVRALRLDLTLSSLPADAVFFSFFDAFPIVFGEVYSFPTVSQALIVRLRFLLLLPLGVHFSSELTRPPHLVPLRRRRLGYRRRRLRHVPAPLHVPARAQEGHARRRAPTRAGSRLKRHGVGRLVDLR